MNSGIGALSKFLQQGRLVFIGMCLALLFTYLTRSRYDDENTSSNMPSQAPAVTAPLVPVTEPPKVEVHPVPSATKGVAPVKPKQQKLTVKKQIPNTVKKQMPGNINHITNKKWFYGDYLANGTITAFKSGSRPNEDILNLLNSSYIRRVSDQLRNTTDGTTIPFLSDYRNPCWYESITTHRGLYDGNQLVNSAVDKIAFGNTLNDGAVVYQDRVKGGKGWRLRCIPYFYIIGFAKCGTTDLYMRLQDHPQIMNGLKKEYHWWSEARFGTFWRTKQSLVPLGDYADMFDVAAESIRVNCVTQGGANGKEFHPCVAGEGSITTIYSNPFFVPGAQKMKNPPHPTQMVPALMKHIIPQVKIILMLRNPVDRLYSSYVYFSAKGGISNEQFHSRATHAVASMTKCLHARGERACVYDPDVKKQCQLALPEGMYSVYLKDWYQVFPREQIKVIKMEDYAQHKADILQDTVQFLELDAYSPELLEKITTKDIENTVKKFYKSKGNILPSTVKVLQEFYKPYVEDLVQLMDDEKWRWF